jgi:hypothetical protein
MCGAAANEAAAMLDAAQERGLELLEEAVRRAKADDKRRSS